ncbi:MAG: hypothetical protein ABDH28_03020, partial [Brevinematia bacterium]
MKNASDIDKLEKEIETIRNSLRNEIKILPLSREEAENLILPLSCKEAENLKNHISDKKKELEDKLEKVREVSTKYEILKEKYNNLERTYVELKNKLRTEGERIVGRSFENREDVIKAISKVSEEIKEKEVKINDLKSLNLKDMNNKIAELKGKTEGLRKDLEELGKLRKREE